MFSPRTLAILALAATLGLIALGVTVATRPALVTVSPGTLAWPAAADAINDVIQIQSSGPESATTIARAADGSGWVVVEAGGYPADGDVVRRALVGVADLRLVEPRTADPARHARLGLLDPMTVPAETPAEDQAVAIGLATETEDLGRLLIGGREPRPSATLAPRAYVRHADEDRTWLAEGSVDVPGTTLGWLPQRIMNIRPTRVWSVVVDGPDREALEIRRDDWQAEDFAIVDPPADRVVDRAFRVNNVATVLENLDLTDVRPAEDLPLPAAPETATIRTYDGITVTAIILPDPEEPGVDWLRFEAVESAPITPTPLTNTGEPYFQPIEAIRDEIATINDTVAGWAYRVPRFKTERFQVTVEDITAAADGEPAPPGAATAPGSGDNPASGAGSPFR